MGEGVNIRQGGDYCSMWLIFEQKTYGEKGVNAGAKWSDYICHSSLYFYCCG